MMDLETLLHEKTLVREAPTRSDILSGVGKSGPLSVFYGETFDEFGHPIDSLKYYFGVAYITKALLAEGIDANGTILIADTAAQRNAENGSDMLRRGRERFGLVEEVNGVYGTGLEVMRMSDFVGTEAFVQRRQEIIAMCESDDSLMDLVRLSVPESRRAEEEKKGFLYSFDEITTIMDVHVKVGPPREDVYDRIARSIAKFKGLPPLTSVYFTPTFPLGMDWSYFFAHEGIEDHGITAYKAGSKRLQRNRILIGRSSRSHVDALIDQSFMPSDPSLPNPVLDVGVIAQMAKGCIDGSWSMDGLGRKYRTGELRGDALRSYVKDSVAQNIMERFDDAYATRV
ncbi:MAG: hypothetical protein ABIH41_02740 [Nanoarchaeota archaeon]